MDPAFQERWHLAYEAEPELFEAFCRAEDPDGRVSTRLLELMELGGQTLLDLGCGTGRLGRVLAPRTHLYVGMDASLPLLRRAHRHEVPGAALAQARGEALPIRDRSMDTILAAWVLVTLPLQRSATILAEMQRVLRPSRGGIWLVESLEGTEFQRLRGEREALEARRARHLVESEGFRVVARVRTHLAFNSEREAEQVLGHLCGEAVRQRLHRAPRSRIEHGALILHRPS